MFCDGLFAFIKPWRILLGCIASFRYHPLFKETCTSIVYLERVQEALPHVQDNIPKKCIDLYQKQIPHFPLSVTNPIPSFATCDS